MKLQISRDAVARLNSSTDPDVLTVRQAQEILGVGRVSIYHLIESGSLLALQKGHAYCIPKCELLYFLEDWERKGGAFYDRKSANQK